MNKPCRYCLYIERDNVKTTPYSNEVSAYCPVMGCYVLTNGTCVDNAKRLSYDGEKHYFQEVVIE